MRFRVTPGILRKQVGELELALQFFKDIYLLSNNGCYFILQVVNWDKYKHTGTWTFPIKNLSDGRTFHRSYESIEHDSVRFKTEIRNGKKNQNTWTDTLYPKYADEIEQGITDCGLTIENIYGNYQKTHYDPINSSATIVVAQKI